MTARTCPTAGKARYATLTAADRAAAGLVFVAGGRVMRTYRCPCGWWHLTRRRSTPMPGEPNVDAQAVAA